MDKASGVVAAGPISQLPIVWIPRQWRKTTLAISVTDHARAAVVIRALLCCANIHQMPDLNTIVFEAIQITGDAVWITSAATETQSKNAPVRNWLRYIKSA